MFNHGEEIFCCVIPSTKYKKNMEIKKIPNDIYEKIINNYTNLNENIILEFKNSKYFVENISHKCYRNKFATYDSPITYYI